MPITLDLGAILAVGAILAATAAILLLTTWRTAGRPAYLAAWGGFCGCTAVAFALYALRGRLPDGLLILLASPLYALAWALFWAGARWLRGARVRPWAIALPSGLWYLACAVPAFLADAQLRGAVGSVLVGILACGGAAEALRIGGSAGLRRAARPLGLLMALFALIMLVRALLFLAGVPIVFGGVVFLSGAMLSVIIGFAGLALASVQAAERDADRVATAAQREAAALAAGRAEVLRLHGALPALIFLRDVDADGTSRLLYRGGDMAEVTGWSPEALAGLPDLESLNGPDAPAMADFLRATLRDGAWRGDRQIRRPDGTLHWMRTHARRLSQRADGGGEVIGTILNVEAEHRAAAAAQAALAREAAALAAGRAEIERLHAGMPVIIFHRDCDPDGTNRLLYRGGDYLGVTGWPEDALPSRADFRAFAGPETPSFTDYIRAVLRDGTASMDWRMRQPDGSWRWMRNFSRRLTRRADGGGEVVGYVADIHAERMAAAQAVAAAADLDRTLGVAPVFVSRGRIAPDGGFTRTYLSRGVEQVTGWPWEEINAPGGLRGIIEPVQRAREPEHLRRLLREGSLSEDLRVRHADGRWLWLRATLAVVERLPDGGAEMIGFHVDVTAEREAQAAVATLDRTLAAAPVV
ncbi:MAG: PAS domain-containing protein, partial [Paracraurococcus sp.]